MTWSTCIGAATINSGDGPGEWGGFESGGSSTVISVHSSDDGGDRTAVLQAIQVNDVISVNGTDRTVTSIADFISLRNELRLTFSGVGWGDFTAGSNTLTLTSDTFASGTKPLVEGDILQWVAADSKFKPTQLGSDVVVPTTTPPTYDDETGTQGELRFDADYLYLCIATDSWKRVALTAWGSTPH